MARRNKDEYGFTPDPNGKIRMYEKQLVAAEKHLNGLGNYEYKAMWQTCKEEVRLRQGFSHALRPMMGRGFKSYDAAVGFLAKRRLKYGRHPMWIWKWDMPSFRWVEIE